MLTRLSKTCIFVFIATGIMLAYLFPGLMPGAGGMPTARADCPDGCAASEGSADLPPAIDAAITCATPGSNGWCIANAALTLTASDPQGYATMITGNINGVDFSCPGPICVRDLSEGSGTIHFQVTAETSGLTDVGSIDFQYDPSPPTVNLLFNSPPEDSSSQVIRGLYTLLGSSNDATSGLSDVEISLDNGENWQPVTDLLPSGDWLFGWETSQLPNGSYTILARAQDVAGNTEQTGKVTVILANHAPRVKVQREWWIWDAGELSVTGQTLPIKSITLTIDCGSQPGAKFKFGSTSNLPSSFQWDRRCGDGHLAQGGDHTLTLTACDVFGNCSTDKGAIKIPLIVVPQPTRTPTTSRPSTQPTDRSHFLTATPTATSTRFVVPTMAMTAIPPAPSGNQVEMVISWWPVIGFAGLLCGLALGSLLDRRQRKAINALREEMKRWAVQDLQLKRGQRELDIPNPIPWLANAVAKASGQAMSLVLTAAHKDSSVIAVSCRDEMNGINLVFTTLPPDAVKQAGKKKKSRLSNLSNHPLIPWRRGTKALELTTLNAGIVFDLELPIVWKNLVDQDAPAGRLWVYFVP